MTLYIAGPMRGRQFYNFPAFDRARDLLRAAGHEVISPADMDREAGFDAMALNPEDPCLEPPEHFCLRECIMRDVTAVLDTEGVCFIDPAWRESVGSLAEAHVARWAGKRAFELRESSMVEVSL